MLCKECGEDISDNAVVCPKCGVAVQPKLNKATAVANCIVYGLFGALIGFLLANYYPLWGNQFINAIAQPFSKARMQLVPGHIALCGIVLVVVGYFVGLRTPQKKKKN